MRDQADSEISKANSPLAPALGELTLQGFVPYGYKGAARKIGGKVYRQQKVNLDRQLRERGTQFSSQCLSSVRKMSMDTANLTSSGNSKKLVTKFNRLKNIKTAVPFFNNLLAILEGLEDMDLIWNSEIPIELGRRAQVKEEARRQKELLRAEARAIVQHAKFVELFDQDSIIQRLNNYPRTRQSIISAFKQLQEVDPEAPRHCNTSCRVAIEQLCIDGGGSRNWKEGLCNLVSSDTDRRHIKAVHHYLSGKGLHGGHEPDKREAEHCLKITIASLEVLLEKGIM